MTNRSRLKRHGTLIIILGLAFGVRCAYAFLYSAEPAELQIWDGTWYDRVARELLVGEGVRDVKTGNPTAFFPPGYPAILALAYATFGESYVVARLLNCVLATLCVAMTYAIGARAYGERVGLLAACLLAVFPGDVFYAPLTLSETTFTTALTGCIWLFQRMDARGVSARAWLAFGILLGFAALIRGAALFWVSVPALLWWLRPGERAAGYGRTLLVVAGMAIAVGPWTIRNAVQLGYPILIATDGPMALFIAHSPPADGSQSIDHWNLRARVSQQFVGRGRKPTEADTARADTRYAIGYFFTHPLHELSLIPRRLYHMFRDDHHGLTMATTLEFDPRTTEIKVRLQRPDEYEALARFADVFFLLVLALATGALAMLSFRPELRTDIVVPATVILFVAMHALVFWGDPRFHQPFIPMLAILSALMIDEIRTTLSRRTTKSPA